MSLHSVIKAASSDERALAPRRTSRQAVVEMCRRSGVVQSGHGTSHTLSSNLAFAHISYDFLSQLDGVLE